MITKPPPYESAPTLKATQASAASPPAAMGTANGANKAGGRSLETDPGREATTSNTPHTTNTSTRKGPTTAAATPPAMK